MRAPKSMKLPKPVEPVKLIKSPRARDELVKEGFQAVLLVLDSGISQRTLAYSVLDPADPKGTNNKYKASDWMRGKIDPHLKDSEIRRLLEQLSLKNQAISEKELRQKLRDDSGIHIRRLKTTKRSVSPRKIEFNEPASVFGFKETEDSSILETSATQADLARPRDLSSDKQRVVKYGPKKNGWCLRGAQIPPNGRMLEPTKIPQEVRELAGANRRFLVVDSDLLQQLTRFAEGSVSPAGMSLRWDTVNPTCILRTLP